MVSGCGGEQHDMAAAVAVHHPMVRAAWPAQSLPLQIPRLQVGSYSPTATDEDHWQEKLWAACPKIDDEHDVGPEADWIDQVHVPYPGPRQESTLCHCLA